MQKEGRKKKCVIVSAAIQKKEPVKVVFPSENGGFRAHLPFGFEKWVCWFCDVMISKKGEVDLILKMFSKIS